MLGFALMILMPGWALVKFMTKQYFVWPSDIIEYPLLNEYRSFGHE